MAFKEILDCKIIGFDLEEYWGKYLCLIQISTDKKVFLFDCLELEDSKKFIEGLGRVFEDKKVMKIGFSIKNDMDQLSKFLKMDKKRFRGVHDF